MDPNWIMAIIAIAAILSPAIVSIIDNIFKYQSKKLELKYPKQREALTNFVRCAMDTYNASSKNIITNYSIAKNDLYIYFDNVPEEAIKNLEKYNITHSFQEYKYTINLIIKALSQQIDK